MAQNVQRGEVAHDTYHVPQPSRKTVVGKAEKMWASSPGVCMERDSAFLTVVT